jgi:ferredoxin
VAPDYFDMDDQGFAVVKVGKGTDSAAVAAFVAAAEACPERAIHLDE